MNQFAIAKKSRGGNLPPTKMSAEHPAEKVRTGATYPARSQGGMFTELRIALRRMLSSNPLLSQLYPPLGLPVVFRPYVKEDREACLQIYRRNEPGRFPPDTMPHYERYLDERKTPVIVAELEGRVVGCGGVQLHTPEVAVLCYGLIDPDYQMRRIGATLTLLRLALIPPHKDGVCVLIYAVASSMPVYDRFGFSYYGDWKDEQGNPHPCASRMLSAGTSHRLRSELAGRGIRLQGEIEMKPLNLTKWDVVRFTGSLGYALPVVHGAETHQPEGDGAAPSQPRSDNAPGM